MINIGLIGYGNWGPNLLRNILANPDFNFIGLAENNPSRSAIAQKIYPHIKTFKSGQDLINKPELQAIVIACTASQHYSLAKLALENGKHVLVEKPICLNSNQALDLLKITENKKLTLMVDHTLIFDGAVKAIKNFYYDNLLGKVSYYDAVRVNLGNFQPDTSVLWDLAPHDLAVMDYLFDEDPVKIIASGYSHVNKNFSDLATLTLHFASKRIATFKFSWVSPIKQRITIIGGDKKMLVWNDLLGDEKIKIYDTGLETTLSNNSEIIKPNYRKGNIYSPKIDKTEALIGVFNHFVDVILGKKKSLMNGHNGLRIIRILEEAERQINKTLNEIDEPS